MIRKFNTFEKSIRLPPIEEDSINSGDMKWQKTSKSFLDRVVEFDFEKRYTRKHRILGHILLWFSYALLYFPLLHLGEHYTVNESILMTIRVLILNMVAFYLFFYVSIPKLLERNYLLFFLISIVLLIELYLVLNRMLYGLVLNSNFPIESRPMTELMDRVRNSSLSDAFLLRRFFARASDVIFTLSPIFFVKIAFDLTRIYAKRVKADRKIEQLKTKNIQIENKFLNAQLNPHFLFNTLNNLYGLTLKKDDLAPELILKFSEVMRYTLYEANAPYISLKKELGFIEDYVELERMRVTKPITFTKEILDKDISNLKIAPLLPFVFIENGFKYGMKSDTPFLDIKIKVEDKNFYFQIENDFALHGSKNRNSGGIGIKNVRKRLELLYPKRHELQIDEQENHFQIRLTINLAEDVK